DSDSTCSSNGEGRVWPDREKRSDQCGCTSRPTPSFGLGHSERQQGSRRLAPRRLPPGRPVSLGAALRRFLVDQLPDFRRDDLSEDALKGGGVISAPGFFGGFDEPLGLGFVT